MLIDGRNLFCNVVRGACTLVSFVTPLPLNLLASHITHARKTGATKNGDIDVMTVVARKIARLDYTCELCFVIFI